ATTGAARADAGALPVRTLVLVGLSFLVCVVGVMNAMLMSVTERFSEIATMKCLGGLDGFIMGLFVFEAVIQGLVGGVVGGLAGLLLALLRGLLEHGALLGAAAGSAGSLLLAVGGAAAGGVVLAVLAAIWPAWLAARLAPMEAMRVD
ncbi:MAG TPA: ABC transporter permease, partial [Polyangiaceae bacterium]|nr:ABC transporter permease [Polyangiaceae bacterium]